MFSVAQIFGSIKDAFYSAVGMQVCGREALRANPGFKGRESGI